MQQQLKQANDTIATLMGQLSRVQPISQSLTVLGYYWLGLQQIMNHTAVALLGLVSPGAATDGCHPYFS